MEIIDSKKLLNRFKDLVSDKENIAEYRKLCFEINTFKRKLKNKKVLLKDILTKKQLKKFKQHRQKEKLKERLW